MSQIVRQTELPAGIRKVTGMDEVDYDARAAVVRKLLHTREVRQLIGDIIPEVLNIYAGKNAFKRVLSRMIGRHLQKSLSRTDDIFENKEIQFLFEDEQFVQKCLEPIPDLVKGLLDIAGALLGTVSRMETREKKLLVGDLLAKVSTGQTGALVTQACRILNDIHKEDPEFFARQLAPGFQKWVEAVDFGEIKEMVDSSAQDVRALVEMVNDTLWQYPAKVVLLLSLLPSTVNMAADAVDISAGKLNDLPPDLLTDVVLSFLEEVNTRSLAGVVNQLTEIVRKVHTGSALLGEAGSPKLPKVLSRKIGELMGDIDPATLWKAKIALSETRATLDQAVGEAVNQNSALRQLSLTKGPEIRNIRLRTLNQKLAAWDQVDEPFMASSISDYLSSHDSQEVAEIINNLLRLYNRMSAEKPEFMAGLWRQFASAVDGYELEEAGRTLMPWARTVVPMVVRWVAEVLEEEKAGASAGDLLGSMLKAEEV